MCGDAGVNEPTALPAVCAESTAHTILHIILDNDHAQPLLAYVFTTFRYLSVYFLLTCFVVKQYATSCDSSSVQLVPLSGLHRFLLCLI